MSDTSEQSTTGEEGTDPGALRERGDKAEAKAKELEAELNAAKRELALTRAGVPEQGTGALFRKAYDGELTSEAIQAAMDEYGITSPEPTPAAAPAPEGAGVVDSIAAGLGTTDPVKHVASADARIEEMSKMQTAAELDRYLENIGLLHDSEAYPEELQARQSGLG